MCVKRGAAFSNEFECTIVGLGVVILCVPSKFSLSLQSEAMCVAV